VPSIHDRQGLGEHTIVIAPDAVGPRQRAHQHVAVTVVVDIDAHSCVVVVAVCNVVGEGSAVNAERTTGVAQHQLAEFRAIVDGEEVEVAINIEVDDFILVVVARTWQQAAVIDEHAVAIVGEIQAAVSAHLARHHDVQVGVVVGVDGLQVPRKTRAG
jgi:hypothetical protein